MQTVPKVDSESNESENQHVYRVIATGISSHVSIYVQQKLHWAENGKKILENHQYILSLACTWSQLFHNCNILLNKNSQLNSTHRHEPPISI